MSESQVFAVEAREETGKGISRRLRREGKIPGIIYGGNKDEDKIATSFKEINIAYNKGGFGAHIVELQLGKQKIKAFPRDVQVHPVTDFPLHVDFQRVDPSTKLHVNVHVNFLNQEDAPGIAEHGGVLNIIRREIELICRADSIPEELVVDLSGLEIGDSVHSSSVKYPEGSEPAITDRDFTIATVVGQTAEDPEPEIEEEVAEGEEGEAAEGAEGEASEEGGEAPAAEGEAKEGGEEKSE